MIKKLLFLFVLFGSFSFATNFNSCQTFATPDTYDLTSNIQINGSSCLTVSTGLLPISRTVIDCHGFEIVGNYSANTYGISIQSSDDVTLQNCIFRQFGSSMTFNSGSNALLQNNTFDNSSASGILFGSSGGLVSNVTFKNSTVSNHWNNGIEIYNMTYGNFSDNVFFGMEHGHGTDRTGQFVYNVAYTNWTNNYMYNNTICFRNDATNVSNVIIANNICENNTGTGFLTFSGSSSAAGRFGNITMVNNSVSAAANSIGFDFGWAASTTTQDDCANWLLSDNTATGGAYIKLDALNSSTSITSLNLGGLLICDADNLQLSNINIQGGGLGRNGMELMHVNNLSLFNFSAWNIYTGIRGLIVNDSVFDTIQINGGQIGSINFAGGTSSRNNLSNIQISNVSANAGVSMGGVGNYVSGLHISDSNTSGWVIGFQSATTAINNTFDGFDVQNTPVAIGVTNLGSGNIIKNGFIKNVTTAFFINSTASGIKTITLENITVSDATESHSTNLDLFKTINPSEILYISLPDTIPAFSNSSYIDLQAYLNRTSIGSANVSIDQLNISIGEVPLEYSRLTWWVYNGTDWTQQTVTNNGLGKLTLNGAKVYPIGTSYLDAIFYYDMCPVINQSGYIVALQNYSGAPNTITGLSNACVVINTSNVEFDCQNPSSGVNQWITNDGTATAAGIYIPAGLNNVSVRNCNIQQYYYGGYSVSNSNNTWDTNQFYNNSITGLYTDSVNTINVRNNTFLLNQIGFEGAFNVDSAFVYLNQFLNNSIRGLIFGTFSDSSTIESNTFNFNNIDITLQSVTGSNVNSNSIENSSYQAIQIAGSQNIMLYQNNLSNTYSPIDASGNTNLSLYNNQIRGATAGGTYILTSSQVNIQNNLFDHARTCGLCLSGTDISVFNNTINRTGRDLGYTAPNLQITSSSNVHVESNILLNATDNGAYLKSINNATLLNNNVSNNGGGIVFITVSNSSILNNYIFANPRGTYITNSNNVSIQSNTYLNNTELGIWFTNSLFNNTIRFNNVSGSGTTGFYFTGATTSGNTLTDNNLTNLASAILFEGGENYDINYNTITSSTQGIRFNGGANNRFSYNNISGHTDGILFSGSGGSNINFSNNRIFSNINTGASLGAGSAVRFDNNEIYLNPRGINIGTANNTLGQDNHFYNNTYSIYVDSASDIRFFNLTNSIFDSTGLFADYSNVSVSETSSSSDVFNLNWTSAPVPPPLLPTNTTSIGNRYINIINVTNTLDISSATFYWNENESANETRFKIMVYDAGTWNDIAQTLDTSNNRIILGASLNGTYALLDNQSYVPPTPPTPPTTTTTTAPINGGNSIYIVNPDGSITQYPFQPLVNATANIIPNITIPQINISVPNISLPNITVRIPQIQPPTDQPSILKYICGGVALLSLIILPLTLKFMKKLFIYSAILVGLILAISAILLYTGVI